MSARKETAEKKLELLRSLRQASHDGTWRAGEMLPTTRELAQKHGVSPWLVTQELQKLVGEGVLHTIPRVGTFVGRPNPVAADYYLMLQQATSVGSETLRQTQIGFEERVAALGGASLVMTLGCGAGTPESGRTAQIERSFRFRLFPGDEIVWETMNGVPCVCFIPPGTQQLADAASYDHCQDQVHFDEADGGRQAAQHLLRLGHRQIAFLGLHDGNETPGIYAWSAQREAGWRAEMKEAGLNANGLSFHPSAEPSGEPHKADRASEIEVATQAARALVHNREISAVVAANDYAALGLFAALRQAQIPGEYWPSVVGFDDLPQAQSYLLTSLRLPWEEIGKAAVNLLYERKKGESSDSIQQRPVKMRLISRLTSRQNWSPNTSHAALAAALP